MREGTIMQYFNNLAKYIQQVEQSARLGITGEAVRAQAFQNLLIRKGICTEEELTAEIGEVIKKANEPKAADEAAAQPVVEIAKPTPEQVQEVQKSTTPEGSNG